MQLQFKKFPEFFSSAAAVFFFAGINSAQVFCGRVHARDCSAYRVHLVKDLGTGTSWIVVGKETP